MGFFKRFLGSGDDGDLKRRLTNLQTQARAFAQQDTFAMHVDIRSESRKIGSLCQVQSKSDYNDFADVAVWILAVFPKELACALLTQFGQFETRTGEPPFGKIIRAIAHINEIKAEGLPGTTYLLSDPDTRPFLSKSDQRTDKAAETLAVALIFFAEDVKGLKTLWHTGIDNPEMQRLVFEKLWMMDSKLAACLPVT
jgi:hypothetical protein